MSKHPSSTILNETYAEFSRQSPKEFQRKLYEHYEKCKVEFFPDTALPTPIIELTPPSSAKAWGEFLLGLLNVVHGVVSMNSID